MGFARHAFAQRPAGFVAFRSRKIFGRNAVRTRMWHGGAPQRRFRMHGKAFCPAMEICWEPGGVPVCISAMDGGCVKTQMRYRRMVGQLAIFDFRISTDVLRSMSF